MSYQEQSAAVYDVIYGSIKDYRAEAERVRQFIAQYKQTPGRDLLDVACGTGLHDQYLVQWYRLEGVDLSAAQLAVARRRLPEVNFYQADMLNFDLGRRYHAVTCLFSAIGHIIGYGNLERAMARMAMHLHPGGVMLVEPWLHPDMFKPGMIHVNHVQLPDVTVVRVSRSMRRGNVTDLTMDHYVSRGGQYQEPFTEHHTAEMYTIDQYFSAMRAAGLETWHDQQGLMGRGIFIGRKPS